MLRRLAVPDPGQLVLLSAFDPQASVDGYFYADTVDAYRGSVHSFAQMSMYAGDATLRVEVPGAHSGAFENAITEAVSPEYFDMVGARASAGRFFNESDDAAVVISEACRLLVAQVALTMTLLVGAGLFTTTLVHLRANDTSLQSQRIVFARAYRDRGDRQLLPPGYYQALVTGLARTPGADAAGLSVYYPTYFGLKVAVPTDYHYMQADGATPLGGTVLTDFVSPGFFDLFRFRLLKGRDVSWDDGQGKPEVALISASLGRALFPGGDEIGRHIRIAGPDRRDVEVIGVVADGPYVKLDDPAPLVVFRPIMQETVRTQFPMAYVRASSDLATVRDGYTRVIKSLGHRSLSPFITSSEWVDGALVRERFTAGLATFAAALTVLLACMGVYGLLAYSVTARQREIGVRVALGATGRTVVWMIVRDGLAIVVPGLLIGVPCAWTAARLVRAQLYGIAPGDPRARLIAAAVLIATVLAASLLPALLASRVTPLEALREE